MSVQAAVTLNPIKNELRTLSRADLLRVDMATILFFVSTIPVSPKHSTTQLENASMAFGDHAA